MPDPKQKGASQPRVYMIRNAHITRLVKIAEFSILLDSLDLTNLVKLEIRDSVRRCKSCCFTSQDMKFAYACTTWMSSETQIALDLKYPQRGVKSFADPYPVFGGTFDIPSTKCWLLLIAEKSFVFLQAWASQHSSLLECKLVVHK